MIRRPPRSTQSRSSAASDVYKRQTFFCSSQLVILSSMDHSFCDDGYFPLSGMAKGSGRSTGPKCSHHLCGTVDPECAVVGSFLRATVPSCRPDRNFHHVDLNSIYYNAFHEGIQNSWYFAHPIHNMGEFCGYP